MASELVKGMQGTDPFYLKTAATLKHFYANNNEEGRCYTSVSIDPRNMREYYWQAFRPVIEDGKASCIMTAYNEINEVPAILNKDVKNVVKGMGFTWFCCWGWQRFFPDSDHAPLL